MSNTNTTTKLSTPQTRTLAAIRDAGGMKERIEFIQAGGESRTGLDTGRPLKGVHIAALCKLVELGLVQLTEHTEWNEQAEGCEHPTTYIPAKRGARRGTRINACTCRDGFVKVYRAS